MKTLADLVLVRYSNWRNKQFDNSKVYSWNEIDEITDIYFRLRSDNFVISIGNISMGGTGKTPFIETLVKDILPPDLSKCIIERGYRRKKTGELIITEDNINNFSVDEIGDEPMMIFEKTRVPVSVSENKFRAFHNAIKSLNPDIMIIDDGFQHRWIERDIEIVIVDKGTIDNPHFPPKGRLREPFSSLTRADIIFSPVGYDDILEPYLNLNASIINFEIESNNPSRVLSGWTEESPEKYYAVCGIANPARFMQSLANQRIYVKKEKFYPDHYNYTSKDIQNIVDTCTKDNLSVITTEKDIDKLLSFRKIFEDEKVNLFVLPIKFKIIEKELLLKELILSKMQQKKQGKYV